NFRKVNLDTTSGAAGGFTRRTGKPRCAHVLDAGDSIVPKKLKGRFEQKFLLERISDLHCTAIFARLLGQFARSRRRPGPTSTSRLGADIENWIADAACSAARQLLMT